MEFNYHNCGVGDASLRRLVEQALGQTSPRWERRLDFERNGRSTKTFKTLSRLLRIPCKFLNSAAFGPPLFFRHPAVIALQKSQGILSSACG